MSLKFFHIFFIVLSALLTFGFAVWAFRSYTDGDHNVALIVGGILSTAIGIGLIIYGKNFLKKLKHVSYL